MKVEQTRSHFSVVESEFSDSQTICRAAVDEEMDDKAKFEGEEHGFYEARAKRSERTPCGWRWRAGRKIFTQKRQHPELLSSPNSSILPSFFAFSQRVVDTTKPPEQPHRGKSCPPRPCQTHQLPFRQLSSTPHPDPDANTAPQLRKPGQKRSSSQLYGEGKRPSPTIPRPKMPCPRCRSASRWMDCLWIVPGSRGVSRGARPKCCANERRARARDGAEGGDGGAQEHPAPCTSKWDMFCTSRGTCTRTLMRFGEGTGSSAHSFHVNGGAHLHHRRQNLQTLILPPLCLIGFSAVQSPFWINYGTRRRARALRRI